MEERFSGRRPATPEEEPTVAIVATAPQGFKKFGDLCGVCNYIKAMQPLAEAECR